MIRRLACILFLLSGPAWADGRPALSDGADLQVVRAPQPVTVAGQPSWVYELHLTNFDDAPLQLENLAVVDAAGRTLASFSADGLRPLVGRPDHPPKDADPLSIPAGVRVVIYLSVDATSAGGGRIEHVVQLRHASGREESVHGGVTLAGTEAPVALGPPLRGGLWTAVYNADWTRGHRRVLYTVAGKVQIPGRYAIDWIKVDAHGRHARGDGSKPADWFGYGEPVLAVADAVVADARDDLPEPAQVSSSRRVPMEEASGNYIALDLGQGRYVFYEHLKPGSIRVHRGDVVKRGQVIGALGYTGSTTGPHLHLHVADGDTPLNAEGIPYVFERFARLGHFADAQAFGEEKGWLPDANQNSRKGELPSPFEVIRFDTP